MIDPFATDVDPFDNPNPPFEPQSQVVSILQVLRDAEAERLDEYDSMGADLSFYTRQHHEVYQSQALLVRELDELLEMARAAADDGST
jgi:hypothetical protein